MSKTRQLNKYFNFKDCTSEQKFYGDFFDEIIRIAGVEALFIPRDMFSVDDILQEPYQIIYDKYYPIPVIQEDPGAAYKNNDTVPSFFGMKWEVTTNWLMSMRMFKELGIEESYRLRPQEGDLILICPERNSWRDPKYTYSMFEINYVRPDNPFWPIGKPYLFTLVVQHFTYSHQNVETSHPNIDIMKAQFSPDAELDAGINKPYLEKKKTLVDFSEKNPLR